MKYLLDTHICIYIIKQKPASVLEKFKTLAPGSVGISSITLAELYYGVEKSQYKEKNSFALEAFTSPLEVVSFDDRACLYYGKLRAYLESLGKPIGALDLMIAAHAVSLGLTLVSHNTKEFLRIPDLIVKNWVTL